ncbi:aspartic peptidase domain-containing protein [Mycena crocata]|nr:aspartic peptidase domain-containing protein [Mycena crocata]
MIFSPLAVLIAIICQLSRAEYRDLHILRTGGGLATVRDHFAIAERARVRYGSIGNNVAVPERERRADTAQGTGLPLTNEVCCQLLWTKLYLNCAQASDQYYYTVVDIGTPPQSFNMIVDTGSGDMIVASASCASCQGAGTLYDYSLSSTAFNNTSRGFKTITYGQGSVNGSVFEDTISLGPYYEFSVDFLQITEVSQGLIPSPVSGILGLAFHGVAQVAGIPLWESLIGTGRTPAPLMAFWLSRFVGSMSATKEQPGGSFTFGGVNSSLFSGEIEFLDITDTENTFWSLNLSDITVQGKAVNIVSATKTAVIDTGTSAIGGPPADVKAIWAVIPGSSLLEDGSGFYEFPCATSMNVSLSFGRQIWAIDPADLNLGPTTQNRCLGGIFQLTTTGPRGWVIGTPFLKNVYTVLRYEPPSVGFAQLSTFARGTG